MILETFRSDKIRFGALNTLIAGIISIFIVACSFEPRFSPLASTISGDGFLVEHLGEQWEGTRTHSITVGSQARDVYVIFSNGRQDERRAPSLSVSPSSVVPLMLETTVSDAEAESPSESSINSLHSAIPPTSSLPPLDAPGAESESLSTADTSVDRQASVDESETTFHALNDSSLDRHETPATLRARASNDEGVNLNVWVQNTLWDDTITGEMVDAVADVFFSDENGTPGIYESTRALFGRYWGAHDHSAIIGETDTIDILLLDIAGAGSPDESNGEQSFIGGYFDPRDLYRRSVVDDSAERALFYIHGPALAAGDNDGDSWLPTHRRPSEMLLTVAHETQHLINFYENRVLRGVPVDTWLDELMSLQAEELVASLIVEHAVFDGGNGDARDRILRGSRGLPARTARGDSDDTDSENGLYGERVSRYNDSSNHSLTSWEGQDVRYSGRRYSGDDQRDYAASYMFGAWLVRNFDNGELLYELSNNASGGREAVTAAIRSVNASSNHGFVQLLDMWKTAVLLSDLDYTSYDLPRGYRMTVGEAGDSISESAFRLSTDEGNISLGSVDAWFYPNSGSTGSGPAIGTPDENGHWEASGPMAAVSATIVQVAENVSDTVVEVRYDPPPGVSVTVLTRKPVNE